MMHFLRTYSPGLDLYCTDHAQQLITPGWDLDDPHDLSVYDISVHDMSDV